MTTSTITPPAVQVARYDAPAVYITPVLEVLPTEPVEGASVRGSSQHILLNTKTGELSFHESNQHLTPWRKEWRSASDVPRDIWKTWHPGTLVCGTGPHEWFELVPELLRWTIDAGFTGHPYFDVDRANALLAQIQPYAQELLSGFFVAGGELDWSTASGIAGRQISRLCRREHQVDTDPSVDADLVDYADLLARFPHVYRPRFLGLGLAKLFEACESETRFLGCNEHWNPEIKKAFGKPYHDGSIGLDVLGIRSWYRTLLLGDDPRTIIEYATFDLDYTYRSQLTATMPDDELDIWVARVEGAASAKGQRVLDARDAGMAYRKQLREGTWDRLAVVGADVADLKRQLDAKVAERQQLVLDVAGWNSSDTTIADRARMSRQAVHAIRTGAPETA
jgi:hypothetical protein